MPTIHTPERAAADANASLVSVRPGDVTLPGGAYVSVDDEGAAVLSAWAGAIAVQVPLSAAQASALAERLADDVNAGIAGALGDAALYNGSFDPLRANLI